MHPPPFARFLFAMVTMAMTPVPGGAQIGTGSGGSPTASLSGQNLPSFPGTRSDPRDGSFVFFPPVPPPFGAVVSGMQDTRFVNGLGIVAPPDLAEHVGEIFYAPLSVWLWSGERLPARTTTRLQAYSATRDALLNELRDRLVTLTLANPTVREDQLRELAAEQGPRLAALEAEAEAIRRELTGRYRYGEDPEWNAYRRWRPGYPSGTKAPDRELAGEFRVARAAAYLQDGLGMEQRWLLREIAMERRDQARTVLRGRPVAEDALLSTYFWPATARIRLPDRIPADLAAKIAAFNRDKLTLKDELGRVFFNPNDRSDAARTAELVRLSDRQWPRVREIEAAAEAIRRELAARPPVPLPELPPEIPKSLADRIEAFNRMHGDFTVALAARIHAAGLASILASSPPSPDHAQRAIELKRRAAERREQRELAVAEFLRENDGLYAELNRQLQSIRTELDFIASRQLDPATGRPTNAATAIQRYNAAMRVYDTMSRQQTIYDEYRTAVLQPGLSPEQRRLLFSSAIAGLAQPLPPGEAVSATVFVENLF